MGIQVNSELKRPLGMPPAQPKPEPQAASSVARYANPNPPSVTITDVGAIRIATINIHKAVPGDEILSDENESFAALRDTASFLEAKDADIIVVQEIDNDKNHKDGVNDQFEELGKLLGARNATFTPAVRHENGDEYGTAVYTRNDFTILQAANVELPSWTKGHDRNVGVADVVTPDGRHISLLQTHLQNGRQAADERKAEFIVLSQLADSIRNTGSITYSDAITGATLNLKGLDTRPIILGGDMNAKDSTIGLRLGGGKLRNAMDVAKDVIEKRQDGDDRNFKTAFDDTIDDARIDHFYLSPEIDLLGMQVREVPAKSVDGQVTDHNALILDFRLAKKP